MPEIVDRMPDARPGGPRWEWADIFDGRVHRFAPDELPSNPRNFGRQVRDAAAKFGVRVRVVARRDQGVYVQRIID